MALALAGAALWYLYGQWPAIMRVAGKVETRWSLVALSAAIVLITYAMLIECWRLVLRELGGVLDLQRAAVIWLGSNLARYIPLSGWQLGVAATMAKRERVPVAVSTGGSLLLTLVNVLTGLGVFAVMAATTPTLGHRGRLMLAIAVPGLILARILLPRLGALLARVTGREIELPRIGPRAIAIAAVGTTVAWILYGIAFWVLAQAILPGPARSLPACIALYTGAYLAGVLAFVPPAGIGAAEFAMIQLAPQLGVFTGPEAALLSLAVRAWRTVLEIVPGVIALAVASAADRRRDDQPSRGSRIP